MKPSLLRDHIDIYYVRNLSFVPSACMCQPRLILFAIALSFFVLVWKDTSRRQQELLVRSTQAIDKSLAAHCDTVKGALGSIVCEGFGPVGTPFLKCARDVEKSVNSLIDDVDTLAKKSSERIQAAQEALGQKTPPAICAKEDAGPGEAAGKGEKVSLISWGDEAKRR